MQSINTNAGVSQWYVVFTVHNCKFTKLHADIWCDISLDSIVGLQSRVNNQHDIISRHTVVCRVAQETRGARQTSVYFTGAKKTPFSRICSSALPEQKHTKFSV